tara:strand:+ start:3793 stop:3999 length:207 start_codon:yes stop_codon:yes gene_type:complete
VLRIKDYGETVMDSSIWITIGIVAVVVWGFIGWEMYTSPVYPDDYPNKPEPSPDQPEQPRAERQHPPR